MSESLGSSSLGISGYTHSLDGTAALEVLLESPLFGSEGKVSDEDGSDLSAGNGTTWGLSGELNVNGGTVELLLVGGSECLSGSSVIGVLDEGLTAGLTTAHDELALGESTMGFEETSKFVLTSGVAEAGSEELGLAIVLVRDSSSGLLNSSG